MSTALAGRTALVTGAARGIGLAVAKALAQKGAGIALVDLDSIALNEACSQMPDPHKVIVVAADVTQPHEVERAVSRTVERFGTLDILVNNAGICPLSSFEAIGEAEWDRVMAVNLKGAFLFCQKALPYLRQSAGTGRVINITSVAGQMGGVMVGAHYAASKAGLIGLSKSLAKYLAGDGVTVNCVAPGPAQTDLTASWPVDLQTKLREQIPLGRFGLADEVAAAVCYLASDDAAFITGATLDINGGLSMR